MQAYQVEYEAWLHQQEEAFLALLSSGASRGVIDTQVSRHDHMMRAWQQKWGPPISRDGSGRRPMRILQQAGGAAGDGGAPAADAAQQHQLEQQLLEQDHQLRQQQEHALHVQQPAQAGSDASPAVAPVAAAEVAAAEVAAGPSSTRRRLSQQQQLLQRPQLKQQQQQQQQQQPEQQQQQQPKPAATRKEAASTTSSSSSGRARSSAFSIQEPTPELLAEAAAATKAAGRTQQLTNATVGSALVVQALTKEPLDRWGCGAVLV
jgi:hypothetical protein